MFPSDTSSHRCELVLQVAWNDAKEKNIASRATYTVFLSWRISFAENSTRIPRKLRLGGASDSLLAAPSSRFSANKIPSLQKKSLVLFSLQRVAKSLTEFIFEGKEKDYNLRSRSHSINHACKCCMDWEFWGELEVTPALINSDRTFGPKFLFT